MDYPHKSIDSSSLQLNPSLPAWEGVSVKQGRAELQCSRGQDLTASEQGAVTRWLCLFAGRADGVAAHQWAVHVPAQM